MSALQQHKLFVFYLKWEAATDRLTGRILTCNVYSQCMWLFQLNLTPRPSG